MKTIFLYNIYNKISYNIEMIICSLMWQIAKKVMLEF